MHLAIYNYRLLRTQTILEIENAVGLRLREEEQFAANFSLSVIFSSFFLTISVYSRKPLNIKFPYLEIFSPCIISAYYLNTARLILSLTLNTIFTLSK